MSLPEKQALVMESAQDADVHDPLTSTVFEDIDTADSSPSEESSTNLLESQAQPLVDTTSNQDIAIESVEHVEAPDLYIEGIASYDDQPWVDEPVDLVDTEDLPSISLGDTNAYAQKMEPQPRTITDPTHAEVSEHANSISRCCSTWQLSNGVTNYLYDFRDSSTP